MVRKWHREKIKDNAWAPENVSIIFCTTAIRSLLWCAFFRREGVTWDYTRSLNIFFMKQWHKEALCTKNVFAYQWRGASGGYNKTDHVWYFLFLRQKILAAISEIQISAKSLTGLKCMAWDFADAKTFCVSCLVIRIFSKCLWTKNHI